MNKSKYINLTLKFGRQANDDRWDIPCNEILDFKIILIIYYDNQNKG